MRGIQMPQCQHIAQRRPRRLTQKIKREPLFGSKSQLFRDDQRGAINQRNIATVQNNLAHDNRSAAVTNACATSMTLRFWRIAVVRSSL